MLIGLPWWQALARTSTYGKPESVLGALHSGRFLFCPRSVHDRVFMPEITLQTPVQFLRGVGPQRAELLGRLGLFTVADLLCFLPRDVLDLTRVSQVNELTADALATVRGRAVDRDARL